MLLKDAITAGLSIPEGNNFYNSKPWFLFVKSQLLKLMKVNHGRREIFLHFLDKHGELTPEGITEMRELFDVTLMCNAWKYDRLWDIYTAEYNPIWNYEGTETRTLSRHEVGTMDQTDTKSGNDSTTFDGDDTTVQSGSVTDTNSGSLQNSRTTYDDNTALDTDKTTDTRSTTTTYNNKTDKTEYGKTERIDYDTTVEVDNDTTRQVEEQETTTRGGNMGTTSTQSMMEQQIDIAGRLTLLQTIALDLAESVSYS